MEAGSRLPHGQCSWSGPVRPRSFRRDASGFAQRPGWAILWSAAPIIGIGVGIAGPLILTVRIWVEKSAIAGLRNDRLRRYWHRNRDRQQGHRSKKPEARHWV